jgi:hypothetical protein
MKDDEAVAKCLDEVVPNYHQSGIGQPKLCLQVFFNLSFKGHPLHHPIFHTNEEFQSSHEKRLVFFFICQFARQP